MIRHVADSSPHSCRIGSHVAAKHLDLSPALPQQCADDFQRCGLAGAVGADKTMERLRHYAEGDFVEGLVTAKRVRKSADIDRRHGITIVLQHVCCPNGEEGAVDDRVLTGMKFVGQFPENIGVLAETGPYGVEVDFSVSSVPRSIAPPVGTET